MWELRVCVGGSGGLLARRSDREWISEGRIFLRRQEGWRLGWVSSGSSSGTEDCLNRLCSVHQIQKIRKQQEGWHW